MRRTVTRTPKKCEGIFVCAVRRHPHSVKEHLRAPDHAVPEVIRKRIVFCGSVCARSFVFLSQGSGIRSVLHLQRKRRDLHPLATLLPASPLSPEVRANAKARAVVEQYFAPDGVRSREVDRALRKGGAVLLDRLCPALRVVIAAPGTLRALRSCTRGRESP